MPRDRTAYAIAHTQCIAEREGEREREAASIQIAARLIPSAPRQIARDINLLAKLFLRWQLLATAATESD